MTPLSQITGILNANQNIFLEQLTKFQCRLSRVSVHSQIYTENGIIKCMPKNNPKRKFYKFIIMHDHL